MLGIKILDRLGILNNFNFIIRKTVNERSFKIPFFKKLGRPNIHTSEPWMIQLLEKLLVDRKDKAYIDVGVNLGQTLIKLKSVDPNISYYGFEPNPACIFYVKELVRVNKFENVTLFPIGISDKTSLYELLLYAEDETDSAASILENFRPTEKIFRKEYVACFNGSGILEKYIVPPIGIIKIDVEGAEKEVIEGFRNRIVSDQPIIQLEILPVYSEKNEERLKRQKELEKLFRDIDYVIFRILTDEEDKLRSVEEIRTIGIHSNLNWCEYLIVHESMKEKIKAFNW